MHIECTLTKLCVDNLFTKFESELCKKRRPHDTYRDKAPKVRDI